ncbi:MAG TPA: DUF6263 family protein [Flavisolibacter sp.]|nr:DUF6263 family protein [Flavisolibacter sp.]
MKNLLVFLVMSLPAAVSAQKLSNKLNFQKGAKMEVVLQIHSVISQGMGDTKVNSTLTRVYDVNDVTSEGISMEHKVKRLQMDFEMAMMGSQSFDSENEADMKGEAGKAMEKTLKNKYSMTIDPTGKVLKVKKDDDNPNTAQEASPDMITSLLGQMGEGIGIPSVGDRTEFKILPEREIGKGESWTDSTGTTKITYTLTELNDTEALIDFVEESSSDRKQEMMGMEVAISTKDKTKGRIILDRKTGLMKEKTAVTESAGTMDIMGQQAPLNTRTTKTYTVKPVA